MGSVSKKSFQNGTRPPEQRPMKTLDGDVAFLKRLSAGERLRVGEYAKSLPDAENNETSATRVVLLVTALTLCEEDGSRMWAADSDEEAIDGILHHDQEVVEELIEHALEVNRMGKHATAGLKEAVGNSDEIPTDSSSTSSPGISELPELAGSLT